MRAGTDLSPDSKRDASRRTRGFALPTIQKFVTAKSEAVSWIGYKVHLSECCDDDLPQRVTQVETVPAIEQDHHAPFSHSSGCSSQRASSNTAACRCWLYQRQADRGTSTESYAIDVMGPVHVDPSWQARTPGALDLEQFHIDWQQRRVTCPQGQQSSAWYLNQDAKGESIVHIFFPKQICHACPVRETCTDAQKTGRSMTLRFPEVRHEQLQAARVRQQTEEFKSVYHGRAGIEGTFSHTTRNTGLRRSRSIGLEKNAPPAYTFSGGNEYSSLRAMANRGSPLRKLGPHVLLH
jgi:transposase